jgi:hypothetical protein
VPGRLLRFDVWLSGLFDPTVREVREMLYQYEFDYVFDSTKFTRAFDVHAASYAEGTSATAQAYRK